MRAQVSMELMMTLAFVIVVLIPIVLVVYTQMGSASERLALEQAAQSAKKIGDMADVIWSLGAPSKTTIAVYMPANVNKIIIGNSSGGQGREIVFRMNTAAGVNDVVELTLANVAGEINVTQAGAMDIEIAANRTCPVAPVTTSCVYIKRA